MKFWTGNSKTFALTALPTSTTRGPSSHLPWPWSAGTWRRWWGPGAGRSWFCRNRWTPPTSHYKKINEISCFWKHCHFYGFPIPVSGSARGSFWQLGALQYGAEKQAGEESLKKFRSLKNVWILEKCSDPWTPENIWVFPFCQLW